MPSLNVTTTSAEVLPARNRSALILQNISDTEVWLNFNAHVTASAGAQAGLRLLPGGTFSLTELPRGSANNVAVYAIHAGAGTKELRYIETL